MSNSGWVVIVDDDPVASRAIKRTLERRGFGVKRFSDHDSVHHLLQTDPVSLLFMDVTMEGDGEELVRAAHERSRAAVVLHSGLDEESLRQLTASWGADHFLCKGDSVERVLDMLEPAPRAPRVLVADDDEISRAVVNDVLADLGCSRAFVADGQAAVEQALSEPFDVLLMDCSMPGLDGFEACRAIRRQEPAGRRTPIVALTAGSDLQDQCRRAGMDAVLRKPPTTRVLSAALKRWLEGAHLPLDSAAGAAPAADDAGSDVSLLRDYCTSAWARARRIQDALLVGNASRVRTEAHALAGASGAVGASEVRRIAEQLMSLGKQQRLEQGDALVARIYAEVEVFASRFGGRGAARSKTDSA